jgi:poly-gamma-glutamate synthesis protein (capsule biosynthesis protein)
MSLRISAVGDVFLDRDEPDKAFENVRDLFAGSSVVFANLEGVYAEDWHRAPSAGVPLVADPQFVPHLAQAGIGVVSLANNHSVDGGFDALVETRDRARAAGMATAGAGTDATDARRPAILDTGAGRVAVLAYASVFPHGYEARPGWPGLAPMRAFTHYEPWESNEWNPGLLPKVSTVPHEGDQAALREDIASAREQADLVVASFHWGDFTRPVTLTDHERRTARVAVDAGADVVLGHHHHLLRGVEHYRGKPIYYGLGHFVFDLPDFEKKLARDAYLGRGDAAEVRASGRRFGEYRIGPREGYPLLPFHPEGRLTGIAVVTTDGDGLRAQFVPCVLGPDNKPCPATDGDTARLVGDYLQRCCDEEDLPTKVRVLAGDGSRPWLLEFEHTN